MLAMVKKKGGLWDLTLVEKRNNSLKKDELWELTLVGERNNDPEEKISGLWDLTSHRLERETMTSKRENSKRENYEILHGLERETMTQQKENEWRQYFEILHWLEGGTMT